jgi:hypothetical protein
MPTMEKFILHSGERGGVLPLLPLKELVTSPTLAVAEKTPITNRDKR